MEAVFILLEQLQVSLLLLQAALIMQGLSAMEVSLIFQAQQAL